MPYVSKTGRKRGLIFATIRQYSRVYRLFRTRDLPLPRVVANSNCMALMKLGELRRAQRAPAGRFSPGALWERVSNKTS